MRTIIVSALALFASVSVSHADFQCPAGQPAWHAVDNDGADYYIYGPHGLDWGEPSDEDEGGKLYLERWDKGAITWRVLVDRTFSNGVSTSYMLFPIDPKKAQEVGNKESEIAVPYETIDEDGQEFKYLVVSPLTQQAWYAGGFKVEKFNNPAAKLDKDPITAPNVYKRMDCSMK